MTKGYKCVRWIHIVGASCDDSPSQVRFSEHIRLPLSAYLKASATFIPRQSSTGIGHLRLFHLPASSFSPSATCQVATRAGICRPRFCVQPSKSASAPQPPPAPPAQGALMTSPYFALPASPPPPLVTLRKGSSRSIGRGNTVVELCSVAISESVCR